MTNIQAKHSKKEYISRINRVIDYIKDNIDQDLSLEQLSGIANFSKFYFHRVFKSVSGETLSNYVNRIRIEKSAFLLINQKDKPVTSIAYEMGFSSPSVYARAFKTHYNLTPSQWRACADNKSKISKLQSNISELNDNSSKEAVSFTLYIDSRTKKPIWRIKMTDNKILDIQVCNMPDMNVAYIRHHGQYNPHDKELFKGLFSKLMCWAIPRQLFNPPETKAMTVYSSGHPDITEPENMTVDVCITVNKDTVVDGDIGKRVISGGQYALISLQDATMEECSEAWDSVFNNWLPESGYQPGEGSYYCHHLNDPEQHPDKLYNIEMYLPVQPL